ncbi:meiosis initiator protein-like isoform X2 [Hoplias malabaricus]|uniref:meiosis initiator protein-like isoform X2 n=2 Tax=Hoplias malabaricus TaxID=27720 RepID=UPI003461FA26
MKQKEKTHKEMRKGCDWDTGWNNSLKEIGCLLPISGTASGRGLTKKETLIHMLQYFDFLQSHIQSLQSRLPHHYLPHVSDRESESESEDTPLSQPNTPPHSLKAKRKYSYTRPRKKSTSNQKQFDDRVHSLHKEDSNRSVTSNTNGEYAPTWSADQNLCLDNSESNTHPDSSDCYYSLNVLLPTTSSSRTGSSADQESPCEGLGSCSICDDRTGSENGSLGSKDTDTPPSGSLILRDRMLGIFPSLGKSQLPVSPSLPQTPVVPLIPLLRTGESLNLSPSLFTSPARGLCHPLLPNQQEELQTLFEDVWVTPKPTVLKSPSLPCKAPDESEDDRCSDDVSWTSKLHIPLRKVKNNCHKRIFRKSQDITKPSLKKKCVNGFIMFCRMNRGLYLRTHPGTPSTVVTKELASLWNIMPKQERRLYCLKARHFSRQQNRNVRSEGQDAEGESEDCIPSPLHKLLAHRDLYFASSGKI